MIRTEYKERIAKISAALSPQNTALVIVDVQSRFCQRPPLGMRAAKRIAKIAPQFRAAGFPIYVVVMNDVGASFTDFKQINLCKFKPDAAKDILITKDNPSAFSNPALNRKLQEKNIKNLLICGLYTTLCVTDTVRDGLKESFNVCVLKDLVSDFANWNAKSPDAYGILDFNASMQDFQGMGALTKTSAQILSYYRSKRAGGM